MAETEITFESVAEAESGPCDFKIKQEKIDPEIEKIINFKCSSETIDRKPHIGANGSVVTSEQESNDDDSRLSGVDTADSNCNDDGEADEKKSIEPVKSSNEILAELFKVFNAAPPEELLNDENLLKKSKHKKHKKEKKKKKKKSKELVKIKSEPMEAGEGSNSSASIANMIAKDDRTKSKHKKHKKEKHKEDKGKKKDKDRVKEKLKERDKDKETHREKDTEKEKEKERSKDKEREKDKLKSNKDKSKDKEKCKEKERKKSPIIKKEGSLELKPRPSSRSYKRYVDERCQIEVPAKICRKADDHRQKDQREVNREQNSFYNGFRDGQRKHRRRSSSNARNLSDVRIKKEPSDRTDNGKDFKQRITSFRADGHISDISLSDEETYLSERSTRNEVRSRHDANSSSNASSRIESRYKLHNSFYAGSNRKHSHERDRSDYHYRSRARSRSRSRDLGIDKKRLLEIARKNAISMFKRGNLPGCAEMSEEIKDKVLLKMRYGGRTVQDLTEFCKKLSNGENLNDISDLSSEEDSDVDKGGNAKAFHHPFVIKDRDPIVLHIRGKAPIVPRKLQEDQTKAITLQFPVSSGQQHRMTEAWIPVVEPSGSLPKLPTLPPASQSTSIFKALLQKNVFQKNMPVEAAQEPAFKAAIEVEEVTSTTPATEGTLRATTTTPTPVPPPIGVPPVTLIDVPPVGLSTDGVLPAGLPPVVLPSVGKSPVGVPPFGKPVGFPPVANSEAAEPFVPDVPVPSSINDVTVFPPAPTTSLDVSSIISKRLNAMRRLQDNPMDSEALKMMYCSQKEMTCWASSKHTPGQFTGSTGANLLSARELNSGPQAWARRDQLTSTVPMTGGMGMHLLKKMGWKPGEGLGREKTGSLQPLLLDVKLDKRGLVSEQDNGYQQHPQPSKKRRNAVNIQEAQQNLQDKHPVSLLNELTSKRKWTPPLYSLENEGGPSHNKMFLFSVSINGQTFTPNQGANTKKDAKVKAARHCLQQMGIIP